jgi:hypothetical protein
MATIKLYINTDRGDISRAFVKSTSEPTTNALPPALVAGNKRNIEVYLIDSAGNYDARSGASNYALSIGAGPIAGTPSSGTFTLTDGTATTPALVHNATAQAVEDALNALNSSAGPFSQLVDVTSTYDGNYLCKFRTTGAVAALAGDASELSPQSAVVVDEARAGDGSTKEQQYIRLLRQPAIFQDSFTQIANGWSGELSANNARVLELMAGRDTIAIPLDVELTETGNEPETIARGNMLLSNEVINPASIDPANLAQILTQALGDARYLRTTNNLSDVTNAATARSNIGAAAAADLTAHANSTSNPHSVTAAQVGLGNVDNTSDADKPVSTAQQTALDLKADATALTTETNARIDADNRREFAGGVAFINPTATTSYLLEGPIGVINTNNFTIQFNGRILTTGGALYGDVLINISGGSNTFFINFNRNTNTSSNNPGNLRISIASNSFGIDFETASYFEDDAKWLFSVDRNGYFTVFKNGVNVGSVDISSVSSVELDGTVLSICNRFGSEWIARDFAIFNTALTATQAAELYQQGLQPWLAANPKYRRAQDLTTLNAEDNSTSGWLDLDFGGSTSLVSIESSNPITGSYSYKFANTTTGTSDSYPRFRRQSLLFNFVEGNTYNIKCKLKLISGSAAVIGRIGSGTGINTRFLSYTTLTLNNVLEVNSTITPTDIVGIQNAIEFIFNGTLGAFEVLCDDIEITQIGSLATLPLDDDCRQLKDISGNRNDATASESGVTHLKQKDLHTFRDDHADGTGGSYLIANADILAENEVITGVTVDGRFYAASGAQDLTKRRIKLQDHGSHVDVKRSNGTTDDSAIAVTNPNDGTDFAISVLTQRI